MLTPARLWRRLRVLFTRGTVEDEMNEEMRIHLEMETAEGLARGLSAEEARRHARIAFGGVERFREEGREARGVSLVEEWAADVKYAVRVLRRSPVFSIVAVVTLSLGIGANTAIFSVVNAVLLRSLPFQDPERLVSVWDGGHSRAEFVAIQRDTRTLASVAAYVRTYAMSLTGDGEPEQVTTSLVTPGFFSTLGTVPLRGRFFRADEAVTGNERFAVLAHDFWRRRYGSDPTIVGRSIELDGIAWQVVGIAPAGFAFPERATNLWVPLVIDERSPGPHWGGYGHSIIGRLKPGVTREQAQGDVKRMAGDLRLANPLWRPDSTYLQGILVSDLRVYLVAGIQKSLLILMGAVGLVLLIACANVANLLMLRGAARQRELAIRGTLGAGSGRLARQLLAEYGVLAAVGGTAAVGVAAVGTRLLAVLLPAGTPRLADATLDGAALAFTALLTLATALLFGVVPARRLARTEAIGVLAGNRGLGREQRRVASILVTCQIALGVVLAIGAGLLTRSLGRLMDVDPGFQSVAVASAQLSPPRAHYQTHPSRRALVNAVLDRLRTSPAVRDPAITTQLPFDATNFVMAMWIDGWTTDPDKLDLMEIRYVSPAFFQALGIPLRAGRAFTDADHEGAEPVAIISESARRHFWKDRDALGGRVHYPWPGWLRIVGVVGDVRNNQLAEAALPTLYVPYDQDPHPYFAVVARATGSPAAAQAAIRAAVTGVAHDVPISAEQTMDHLIDQSVQAPRSLGRLLLGFGGLALLLSCIGTYGLVAYGVERRAREIAVRLAVGAQRRDVLGLVLGEGARLAAGGLAIGLVAAFGLSRLLRGLLFEVTTTDPVAFVAAPSVLAITVLLACLVPAFRATRVDPNTVLRSE